jgi:hypothetical protein
MAKDVSDAYVLRELLEGAPANSDPVSGTCLVVKGALDLTVASPCRLPDNDILPDPMIGTGGPYVGMIPPYLANVGKAGCSTGKVTIDPRFDIVRVSSAFQLRLIP